MAKNIFETLVGALVLLVAVSFVVLAWRGGTVDRPSGLTLTARFDRVDGLVPGSDVRVSGLTVGSVVEATIDPQSYLAVVKLSIDDTIKVPEDSSAEILGDGLLGSKYLAIIPGGSDTLLKNGDEITSTQASISIEALIGKFMGGGVEDDKPAKKKAPKASENEAEAPKNEEDVF
jgi:phospholipid/cholesterol/gamma-HCH transport system substrate-binding protein